MGNVQISCDLNIAWWKAWFIFHLIYINLSKFVVKCSTVQLCFALLLGVRAKVES
jgi:hypothetical protein